MHPEPGTEPDAAAPSSPDDFVSRVVSVVETIPPGTAMSYGEVAAAIGSRAPRAVGKVMAHYGSELPWWRVVRSDGRPPDCHEGEALEHYRAEGTPLRWGAGGGYRVDRRAATPGPDADAG